MPFSMIFQYQGNRTKSTLLFTKATEPSPPYYLPIAEVIHAFFNDFSIPRQQNQVHPTIYPLLR